MNADRIIQMVINMVLRRGINAGINKGSDYLAARGKRPDEMTDAERESAQRMRKQAGQARRMIRMGRRLR